MKTKMIVTNALKKYQLSDVAIDNILKSGRERELVDNEVFLDMGQLWNNLIIVLSGAMRFYYYNLSHEEVNKKFMFEGECFVPAWGDISNNPSEFAIASIRRSTLFTLSYAELQNIISEFGEETFYVNILRDILAQKTEVEKMLVVPCPIERYRISMDYFNDKPISIPLKYVASYIGITNVSLSRIRGKLRENNEI